MASQAAYRLFRYSILPQQDSQVQEGVSNNSQEFSDEDAAATEALNQAIQERLRSLEATMGETN